jgi:hypothetical protein
VYCLTGIHSSRTASICSPHEYSRAALGHDKRPIKATTCILCEDLNKCVLGGHSKYSLTLGARPGNVPAEKTKPLVRTDAKLYVYVVSWNLSRIPTQTANASCRESCGQGSSFCMSVVSVLAPKSSLETSAWRVTFTSRANPSPIFDPVLLERCLKRMRWDELHAPAALSPDRLNPARRTRRHEVMP